MAPAKLASFLLLAVCLTGCSTVGGPPPLEAGPRPGTPPTSPRPDPDRDSPSSGEASEIALAVVETAFGAIGTPYQWGGTDANGFDCSGLIRYAYGQFGIDLPRISRDQLRMGSPVDLRVGALQPGDVLGFSATVGGEASHVGLYVGDGQFIHSSTRGVRVSDLREPYWQQHFMAARRMVR